jgi:hypothetical protein
MEFTKLQSKIYDDDFSNMLLMMGSTDNDEIVSSIYDGDGDSSIGSGGSLAAEAVAAMFNFIQSSSTQFSVDQELFTAQSTPTSKISSSLLPLKLTQTPKLNMNKTHYFRYFRDHRKLSFYYPFEKYLSYYTLFLVIIGTICNFTSFFIMHKKNMSKHSCMRYLSILSLTDVIVLYQWNLNTFIKYNLSRPPIYSDLEEISLFWCRWISYLAFSSLQLSSWLLSLVSFDRFMIIYSRWWRTHIMSEPKIVNLIIICLATFICLLNSHLLFLNGYKKIEIKKNPILSTTSSTSINFNNTLTNILMNSSFESNLTNTIKYEEVVVCYKSLHSSTYIWPNWQRVHLLMYNFIPFSIMFICNSMIIYNIKFHSSHKIKTKSKSNKKRKTRTSFMLVLVTFSFMFLTLPSVIVHTFFRDSLSNKPYRRLVNLTVNNLLHTSHAIDFFLYVFTAPNFRAELYVFFSALYAKITRKSARDFNTMTLRNFTTQRKIVNMKENNPTTSKLINNQDFRLTNSDKTVVNSNKIVSSDNNDHINNGDINDVREDKISNYNEYLLPNNGNKFEITKESF